ncbi:hypothetical protein EG68_00964 [Paragonimus skrjabini miyazakii]|uniref:Secreted protein n=1 Tax=Paragonimus skrjabini miyazakii TaxID=59628 RepID=A0A8S9ZCE8_9TREM|nr:hypothetical protein EG68_00964 [Paragonimus skrjabini miyazakii]
MLFQFSSLSGILLVILAGFGTGSQAGDSSALGDDFQEREVAGGPATVYSTDEPETETNPPGDDQVVADKGTLYAD